MTTSVTTRLIQPGAVYPGSTLLTPFDSAQLAHPPADAHWIAYDESGTPVARASVWHRNVPSLSGERLGLIGHFAAANPSAAAAILTRACTELAAAGCKLAVGPMDGDTWRSYRFVTAGDETPPFFLEPTQPSDWPAHWTTAGFTPLAGYHSTVSDDLAAAVDSPRQHSAAQRAHAAGIRLRPLDPARWDDELRRVYTVAAVSFRANFLFTPLSEPDFLQLYHPLRFLLRPEIVLLAEDASAQPVGFVLALPDRLDLAQQTFIVKTVAVLPEYAGSGLGRLLVGQAHAAAQVLGYRRAIHALMHDANASRHLSARFGARLLRRYTLFSRRLP